LQRWRAVVAHQLPPHSFCGSTCPQNQPPPGKARDIFDLYLPGNTSGSRNQGSRAGVGITHPAPVFLDLTAFSALPFPLFFRGLYPRESRSCNKLFMCPLSHGLGLTDFFVALSLSTYVPPFPKTAPSPLPLPGVVFRNKSSSSSLYPTIPFLFFPATDGPFPTRADTMPAYLTETQWHARIAFKCRSDS